MGQPEPNRRLKIRLHNQGEDAETVWAEDLGITPNNATVRLHRARKALKRELERSCGTCATHGCLDCGCGGSRRSRVPSSS